MPSHGYVVAIVPVFACHRNRHAMRVAPPDRYVVCPECGSAGETVTVRLTA